MIRILFVCTGNTCRSPMAESILNYYIKEYDLDWEVESAALRSWNVGRKPEERCLKVLGENGLTLEHYGRMITDEDFKDFDYIFGMDDSNVNELRRLAEESSTYCTAKIELLGSYIGRSEDKIIFDPYFSTGMGGFRCTYAQINSAIKNFLRAHAKLRKKHYLKKVKVPEEPNLIKKMRSSSYKISADKMNAN